MDINSEESGLGFEESRIQVVKRNDDEKAKGIPI